MVLLGEYSLRRFNSSHCEDITSQEPIQNQPQDNKSQEKFVELIPIDQDKRGGEDDIQNMESPLYIVAVIPYSEETVERHGIFTGEDAVERHLQERQKLSHGGRNSLGIDLEQNYFSSRDVTGGDIDRVKTSQWQVSMEIGFALED